MQSRNIALLALGLTVGFTQSASAFTVVVENDNGNDVTVYAPPTGVGLDVDKIFVNLNPIVLRLTVTDADKTAGLVEISEGLLNDTDFEWADFHMELQSVTGPAPAFGATPGYLWESYGGDGELASVTNIGGQNIDILWTVADGDGAYSGYFQNTPGRIFIDVRENQVGDEFFLIETPSVVPEPATMAGLAGAVAFFARRRRSK